MRRSQGMVCEISSQLNSSSGKKKTELVFKASPASQQKGVKMNHLYRQNPEKGERGAAVFILQEVSLVVKLILYKFQLN